MSTPHRDKILSAMKASGKAMTLDELAKATGLPRMSVSCSIHTAPRDTFKRAHGTKEVGGRTVYMYELGSRERKPAVTGVWSI
jgi:DNA-binding transcriptional regulator GbsR (MarR family)